MTLKNHVVRVVQTGNWKYQGTVTNDTETHLTIIDDHTGREVTVRKDTLLILEVLE